MNFPTKFSFVLVAFFFSQSIFAQVLTEQKGSEQIHGVTLATTVTTNENTTLHLIGAGLRSKKVVFVNVKVYVAELFAADMAKFQKKEALKTAVDAAPLAIQLHFLRDVDAGKVQSSFKEALETNKVDLKKPEIQKFLDATKNGEAKEGKTLTILATKKTDGSESVTYEDSNLKATTVSGGPGFIQDIFSIWLGHPSDDGIAQLKTELLK